MPSGVRARARAERERAAAEAAVRRAREAATAARRRALLDKLGVRSLGRLLSLSKQGKQSGGFATRRRTQVRTLVTVLLALNIVLWFVTPSWTARLSAIAFSVLIAPVLYTLLFRRS
jgi:hypothetical protein